MKLHCRTRQGRLVRVTLRDGTVLLWTFRKEHRSWIEFAEGTVDKEKLRAFVAIGGVGRGKEDAC